MTTQKAPELANDEHWLPLMLAKKAIRGYFLFDGDEMLVHEICEASRKEMTDEERDQ